MVKITPQHDLKVRTPERSEWLVAGGVAKRNPRYRDTNHNASERREYHLHWRLFSRLSDAFSLLPCIPRVTLTLHPRLRVLGLKPSAFNLSGWIPTPPITAARPERSNARAKRVARSRGCSVSVTLGNMTPLHDASERREYHFPPRQNSRPSLSLQSESDAVALLKKLMKIITTKDRFLPLL